MRNAAIAAIAVLLTGCTAIGNRAVEPEVESATVPADDIPTETAIDPEPESGTRAADTVEEAEEKSASAPAMVVNARAVYHCREGESLEAEYLSLDDGSQEFVRLFLPDGSRHSLPRLASASGARYTDDFRYAWWIKGREAVLQRRDDQGEWQTLLTDCTTG